MADTNPESAPETPRTLNDDHNPDLDLDQSTEQPEKPKTTATGGETAMEEGQEDAEQDQGGSGVQGGHGGQGGEEKDLEQQSQKEKDNHRKTITESQGDTQVLDSKIKENEELQMKLESALSNQAAQREAYQKLINDNAALQKHHDDMKVKYDEMKLSQGELEKKVETLKSTNQEQGEEIGRLKKEILILQDNQGGDEQVKDLQEKLIRLAGEQEEKDRRLNALQKELEASKEQLKSSRNGGATGANDSQKSKACVIM